LNKTAEQHYHSIYKQNKKIITEKLETYAELWKHANIQGII